MYARLSRYTMQVTDRALYRPAAEAGGGAPTVVDVLTGLPGCRGAWVLAEQGDVDEADLDGFFEVFVSLWDTREQAEQVADRAREAMQTILGGSGVTLAQPPQSEILRVLAGRPL